MIVYQLVCEHDHTFDSWFRDSAAYDALAAVGEVVCPSCGSTRVTKALMAPRLGRRKGQDGPALPPPGEGEVSGDGEGKPRSGGAGATAGLPAATPHPAAAVLPPDAPAEVRQVAAQVAVVLRALRSHVEKTCDYVGESFAEEARKIHYGEADSRGIYGEATAEEAEELRDEGIAVSSIPWVRNDG